MAISDPRAKTACGPNQGPNMRFINVPKTVPARTPGVNYVDGLSISCGQFRVEVDGTIRTGPDQDQEKIENPGPNGPWIPDGHMTHI